MQLIILQKGKMASENTKKTNAVIKVDPVIYSQFVGYSKIKGETRESAIEKALKMYIDAAKKEAK